MNIYFFRAFIRELRNELRDKPKRTRFENLEVFKCRSCRGVIKCCCTSCALCRWEGWPYSASWCKYVDVSVDTQMPHPLSSNLEEYHILRFISLFTSENLILGRFSDKNIHLTLDFRKSGEKCLAPWLDEVPGWKNCPGQTSTLQIKARSA